MRQIDFSDRMDAKRPPNDQPQPALQPPQFTLRTLLWIMTGLCGLLAGMTAAGPIGGFALLILVLAVVAHVVGNALGTRLREIGSDKNNAGEASPRPPVVHSDFAPVSRLSQRTGIGLVMVAFTLAGAILCGAVGGALLIWLAWEHLNIPTAIVAISSSSVLGGFLGFTTSSFTQTAGGAWWEAHSGARSRR